MATVTPKPYIPFPNMTSRHLRCIIEWAIEHGVQEIDKLEIEMMRHVTYPADSPYATKWLPNTRGKRIKEIEQSLEFYVDVYSMLREIKEQMSQNEAERFAHDMAAHLRGKKQ